MLCYVYIILNKCEKVNIFFRKKKKFIDISKKRCIVLLNRR